MDSTQDNNESDVLSCHASPLLAPPPSPLHDEEQQLFINGNERMRRRSPTNCEALADDLSSSLAIIAQEERRKEQYRRRSNSARSSFGVDRRQSRGESDGGGDASEESWLSFLGTQAPLGPPLVSATASSGEDRYSSGDRASNDSSTAAQYHHRHRVNEGPVPPSAGNGLPFPVNDTVESSHGNAHASVIAYLPPPKLKSGGGSGSSSLRSASSDKSRSVGDYTDKPKPCLRKRAPPDFSIHQMQTSVPKAKKQRTKRLAMGYDDEESSSSSDDGYDASSSDNRGQPGSFSSPSVSSSEDGQEDRGRNRQFISRAHMSNKRSPSVESSGSVSSYLADFGDSCSASSFESDNISETRPSLAASFTQERKRSHDGALIHQTAVKIPVVGDSLGATNKMLLATKRRHQIIRGTTADSRMLLKPTVGRLKSDQLLDEQQAPIFSLGCDMMAHCMTYLEPTEVHSILTVPLSKQWRETYSAPQDLWRILCLTEPFKAKFGPEDLDDSSDESISSLPLFSDPDLKHVFGKYRLLYTSFIRCLRYLSQIKDDAIHGRAAPSVLDYGGDQSCFQLTSNSGLRKFLAKARVAVGNNKQKSIVAAASAPVTHVGLSDDDRSMENEGMVSDIGNLVSPASQCQFLTSFCFLFLQRKKLKTEPTKTDNGVRYGHSLLTQRLLGPSKTGDPGNVELPWSCAIYSIVNWMAAFSDVEGIQTMCLKVLPFLLEDEGQRTTAQNAGLTDIVLRAMVVFPNSIDLHTAAFHTIVLLARPLGGREGMLFHSSMVNSSGIFSNGSRNGKSGIAVMLDSMERFQLEDILQAMSCWSLVNIALAPSQKSVLVKLGGIKATTNAMMQHPYNAEVQFRALFALINLVIPCMFALFLFVLYHVLYVTH